MAFFQRRKVHKDHQDAHLNWMGGPSFDIEDPLLRLRLNLGREGDHGVSGGRAFLQQSVTEHTANRDHG